MEKGILVTGSSGQIGSELILALKKLYPSRTTVGIDIIKN